MPVGALALWLAAWSARSGAIPHPPVSWSERVEVTARVVPAATRAAHLGDGGVFDTRALAAAGPDLARWSTLASRASGARNPSAVRVDGVEGGALPDASSVGAMSLASDPFSVAAASASGDVIDIATSMRTRWSLSGDPGLGSVRAQNPLGAAAPRTRHQTISAGGPIGAAKRTSLSFSAAATSDRDFPTFADPEGAIHVGAAHAHTSQAWTTGITQALGGFQLGVTGGGSYSADDAAGVGGEQGPSGALNLTASSAFSRLSLAGRTGSWSIRGAASAEVRHESADALSGGRGLVFASMLLSGAPDVVTQRGRSSAIRMRVTATGTSGAAARWLIGMESSRDAASDARTFNPAGMLIVTSPHALTGTLIAHDRATDARVTTSTAALFAERVIVDHERVWARAGTRLTRTSNGTSVDPRLTLGVNAGALLFGASAGLFTEPWSTSAELERRFVHVPGETIADATGSTRTFAILGTGADRRDGIIRIAMGHSGRVTTEIDQTWRMAWRLAGMTRAVNEAVIADTIDLSRQRREGDTHASVSFAARDWTSTANYTFAVANDNTDGPLSFGPDPTVVSPWAPSSQVPRHRASLVLSGGLGRGVRVIVSAAAETGTAYSRLTGLDPSGQLTFSGLDGSRHEYRAEASRDLSAYFARTVVIRRWHVAADAGLRLENLLNGVSPIAIAATSGSSRAGQAVSAGPGRSASFWATFGWR